MKQDNRTFIGIKITPGETLLEQLQEFKNLFIDENIKWVPPDNFHLTLRFLGETSPEKLQALETKLEQIAKNCRCFEIIISGSGIFGKKNKPRVIFLGINFPEELKRLAEEIEKGVVGLGFHNELKPFRPHLTLGRIKQLNSRNRFIQIMSDYPQTNYQTVRVSEFVLYQSILYPTGPKYKPIKSFSLNTADPVA